MTTINVNATTGFVDGPYRAQRGDTVYFYNTGSQSVTITVDEGLFTQSGSIPVPENGNNPTSRVVSQYALDSYGGQCSPPYVPPPPGMSEGPATTTISVIT